VNVFSLDLKKGDVGVSPGSSIGIAPANVVGKIHTVDDGTAGIAQMNAEIIGEQLNFEKLSSDILLSVQTFRQDQCTLLSNALATDLSSTQAPGVYCFGVPNVNLGKILVLDGQNDPNAMFVFITEGTFITASGASIVLINGARACGVFFVVGSSATLGIGTVIQGSILAHASVTATTNTVVNGYLVGQNGAVTLDTTTVTICEPFAQQNSTTSMNTTTSTNSTTAMTTTGMNTTTTDATTTASAATSVATTTPTVCNSISCPLGCCSTAGVCSSNCPTNPPICHPTLHICQARDPGSPYYNCPVGQRRCVLIGSKKRGGTLQAHRAVADLFNSLAAPFSADVITSSQALAASFSTTGVFVQLTQVQVSLELPAASASANFVFVDLFTDAGGPLPGSSILSVGTVTEASLATAGTHLVTFPVANFLLQANTRYWIVLSTSTGTILGWSYKNDALGVGVAAEFAVTSTGPPAISNTDPTNGDTADIMRVTASD
jgi:hypothetical protein